MDANKTLSLSSHNRSSMQSPIPQGSVLRDRYIIRNVIGQGGMGRTYVAEDTERFHEVCVLKEFIPLTQSPEVVVKAKELFQREANTLYQIKHPQVPEFRATFEAEGRLFLVQDYVEGRTYRQLLAERRQQRTKFTEAEAGFTHPLVPAQSQDYPSRYLTRKSDVAIAGSNACAN
jgi:serine/threonine protein kinase